MRAVGYAVCTMDVSELASLLGMPYAARSLAQPAVTLPTTEASVALVHAGAAHIPVSQLLSGPTTDAFVPATTSPMRACASRHFASDEVTTEARVCWH